MGYFKRAVALFSLAALASCDSVEEAAPVKMAEPLPAAVCKQATEAVRQVSDTGVLMLSNPTEGVIALEYWLPLKRSHKDSLLTAIGLAATCAGEPRLEQEVTLRSETGTVLARQVVQTSYSAAEALQL